MPSPAIENLKARFREVYGQDALSPYTPDSAHGTCFIVRGIPATFSVHTQDGALPNGEYDVQIEGSPPGDYVFTEVMTLDRLMDVAARMAGPESLWPLSW